MKNLIYQYNFDNDNIVTDYCIGSVKKYCARHEIDYFCQKDPILYVKESNLDDKRGFIAEFEKFNCFSMIDYDNVCFIDSNVFMKSESENIFDTIKNIPDYEIGMVHVFDQPYVNRKNIKYFVSKIANNYLGLRDDVFLPIKKIHDSSIIDIALDDVFVFSKKTMKKYFENVKIYDWIRQEDFVKFTKLLTYGNASTQVMLNYWCWKNNIHINRLNWNWNLNFIEKNVEQAIEHSDKAYFFSFKSTMESRDFGYHLSTNIDKGQNEHNNDFIIGLTFLRNLIESIDKPSKKEMDNLKFSHETIEKIKQKAISIANVHDENASFQSSDVGFIIHQLVKAIRQLQRENI